eukprot:31276-Pelagococcus_subviridis.AAC.3
MGTSVTRTRLILALLRDALQPLLADLLSRLLHERGLERADVLARVGERRGYLRELALLGATPEEPSERGAVESVDLGARGIRVAPGRGRVAAARAPGRLSSGALRRRAVRVRLRPVARFLQLLRRLGRGGGQRRHRGAASSSFARSLAQI